MPMSKKDYIAIADAVETYTGITPEDGDFALLARDLADIFERDNPLFDRARFLIACGAS